MKSNVINFEARRQEKIYKDRLKNINYNYYNAHPFKFLNQPLKAKVNLFKWLTTKNGVPVIVKDPGFIFNKDEELF